MFQWLHVCVDIGRAEARAGEKLGSESLIVNTCRNVYPQFRNLCMELRRKALFMAVVELPSAHTAEIMPTDITPPFCQTIWQILPPSCMDSSHYMYITCTRFRFNILLEAILHGLGMIFTGLEVLVSSTNYASNRDAAVSACRHRYATVVNVTRLLTIIH